MAFLSKDLQICLEVNLLLLYVGGGLGSGGLPCGPSGMLQGGLVSAPLLAAPDMQAAAAAAAYPLGQFPRLGAITSLPSTHLPPAKKPGEGRRTI